MANVNMTGPLSGAVQINGVDYKPTAGIYSIPQNLVPQAETCGLELVPARISSVVPTQNDIPAGTSRVWKNTGDGTVKLYYNDGGTFKTVALS
jgi:hypothetical protein